MQKQTYCFHGLNNDILNNILNLPENSIVFFDDGLSSLYNYETFLNEYQSVFKIKFIIAINPWIVKQADKCFDLGKIKLDYERCDVAHDFAKKYKFYYYLTSDMIKDLHFNCNIEIADHSSDHFLFEKRLKNLKEKVKYYKEIIQKSKEFYKELNIYPTKYVRPYNKENLIYETLVKKILNIKEIYGAERIDGEWNKYNKGK